MREQRRATELLAVLAPAPVSRPPPPGQVVAALGYDSRRVVPGSVFVACAGSQVDGHAYVAEAEALGAVGVVCQRPVAARRAWTVQVEDSRLAMAQLARAFYGDPAAALEVVGVTGTNGKTSTVALLARILTAAGRRTASVGTLGVRFPGLEAAPGLTTPEALDLATLAARVHREGGTSLAMEVSSQALTQRRPDALRFDVAVFTNLGHDHLDAHGDMAGYFAAKARLFAELLKPGGRRVLAGTDAHARRLADADARWFGIAGDRAMWAEQVRATRHGLGLTLCAAAGRARVETRLLGTLQVDNLLAAAAAATALGLDLEQVAAGLADAEGPAGRMQRVDGGHAAHPMVVVDYAHTPQAVTRALAALRPLAPGRLVAVVGCGGDRDPSKREPMGRAAGLGADRVVVTSDNPRSEDPTTIAAPVAAGARAAARAAVEIHLDRADAIDIAIAGAGPGDLVALLGRGHESHQLVMGRREPCDDALVARRVLERRPG